MEITTHAYKLQKLIAWKLPFYQKESTDSMPSPSKLQFYSWKKLKRKTLNFKMKSQKVLDTQSNSEHKQNKQTK